MNTYEDIDRALQQIQNFYLNKDGYHDMVGMVVEMRIELVKKRRNER